jgi:hypothetical protein
LPWRWAGQYAAAKYIYMSSRVPAKLAIYRTIIKPAVTYARETWVLTKKDEALINTWEGKVLRKIFGPVNEGNVWRIRSNQELRCMYQDMD